MPYYYFGVTTSLPGFGKSDGGLRRGVLNAAVCSAAAITTALPRPQKSLSATWCMKAHCLLIQLWVTPPTPSAQMQYDPAATIHFSLWRRFNEFLLRCVCMSLCLPPSFWSSSPSVRLGNASAAAGEPLCFLIFLIFFFTSRLWIRLWKKPNKSASLICTYWGVFIYFFWFKPPFQLECDRRFSSHPAWQTTARMDMSCSVLHKSWTTGDELALSLQNKY